MKLTNILKAAALAGALMCTTALTGPAFAASVPEGTALAADQTYTYRVLDTINVVDPQMVEAVEDADVVNNLFEGLYNEDKTGAPVPGVALSYDVNAEKNVYTFHLRDNAKWSNGDPVTAGDFVYGFQRAVDPVNASPYSFFLSLAAVANADEVIAGTKPVTDLGVKAIDDLTFEVTLSASLPYFVKMMAHATVFPAHRATIEKFGADWTKPENIVSNGAYKLVENSPGERVVLERNSAYWDDANTVINKVVVLSINEEDQALTRYLAGELDKTDIPTGQYPSMLEQYPNDAHSAPRLCTYYFSINMTDTAPEALKDVRVRTALSYAVDRDVIINGVLQSGQTPAYTFTPAVTSGFETPDIAYASMTQEERDAKAKELMAEAGYGPDKPLVFEYLYNTSEAHKKIATVVSQMWKEKLGVELTLIDKEFQSVLAERHKQAYQIARNAWCADYNEASTFLSLMVSSNEQNDSKYINPEVDALMLKSQTSENPNTEYKEVEALIARDVPIIPIYFYATSIMMKPAVRDFPFTNGEQIWYAKDLYKVAE